MGGNGKEIPTGALEDVAYLARSANRVRLLDVMASDAYTRRGLADRTEIARTTIGRIINEFEKRGWVTRTIDGEYTATPSGAQVIAEFLPLVESMAVIQDLGELVAWFQATEDHIDLRLLRDATARRPEPTDPLAPTAAYLADLRSASTFHCLVGVAPPVPFEQAMRDGVVERGMDVEHVISESEFAYLRDDPERMARWHAYIEAGANVYRYDGEVPCNFVVLDDTVYIAKSQSEYGEPYTVIESDNEAVRSWALDIIERHRAAAEHLEAAVFAE